MNGTPAQASTAPRAPWTPRPPPKDITLADDHEMLAWNKAAKFSELWEKAITRNYAVTCCKATEADHIMAFRFFKANPQAGEFRAVAVAINAWDAGLNGKNTKGYDKLFHCRSSQEIKSFLSSFEAGKLESEIGRYGLTINTWNDLRSFFTHSELVYYGWKKDPILDISPEELWEHNPYSPKYYRSRMLDLPPEVAAAEQLRLKNTDAPQS